MDQRPITFGSVCSGIEAASVAWSPIGWRAAFHAEIDAFPSAVLADRFQEVPNDGDFTKIEAIAGTIDVLVGGTPCQSFSVAGLRKGLDDDRGNLSLEFLRLAGRLRPSWVVWENVPGVLSSLSHDAPDCSPPDIDLDGEDGPADGEEVLVEDGYEADEVHAFNCFLAGLSELGYGWAYRILDAQYVRVDGFGRAVPQRRRRVFVVGYSGEPAGVDRPKSREDVQRLSRISVAVLFDRESLSRNPPPRRTSGTDIASVLTRSLGTGGADAGRAQANHLVAGPVAPAITGNPYGDHESREGLLVAGTRGGGTGDRGWCDDLDRAGAFIPNVSGTITRKYGDACGRDLERFDMTVCKPLTAHGQRFDYDTETFVPDVAFAVATQDRRVGQGWNANMVAHTLRGDGFDASEDGTGRGTPLAVDVSPTLFASNGGVSSGYHPVIAFDPQGSGKQTTLGYDPFSRTVGTLDCKKTPAIVGAGVRRLTPVECEKLQGFPPDWTLVPFNGKPSSDGPRYKAIGNSMAVNCMRWIGQRIELMHSLQSVS
jgi:DNA (cytosine-5)-methyltransferase 1